MIFTNAQIESKLQDAEEALERVKGDVEFWRRAKEVTSDQRFIDLDTGNVVEAISASTEQTGETETKRYGRLKALVYECLPETGSGLTTSQIAEAVAQAGYNFSGTTPPQVSVNESLRTLEGDTKVMRLAEKGPNGSILWRRVPVHPPVWPTSFEIKQTQ